MFWSMAAEIVQVLVNLISNAVKFSPSKKQDRNLLRKKLWISRSFPSRSQGVGMSEAGYSKQVFEKFYQAAGESVGRSSG